MGNSDSRAQFISGLHALTVREVEDDDEFWTFLFKIPLSTEDVFGTLDVDFMRKLKTKYPSNLRRLLEQIIKQMKEVCELVKNKKNPWTEAQLCVRLLTRLAPFLQEDADDEAMDKLIWGHEEGKKSIGIRLFHYINRFLFLERFTVIPVPGTDAQRSEKPPTHKIDPGLLWKGGIGAPTTMLVQQTAQLVHQRVEVLRCLLSCLSGPLFQSCEDYGKKPSKWLLAYTSGDIPYTANVFCSLMSTVFAYDPVGWGVPYGGLLSSNIEEELVDHALQLLCVIIDFIPYENDDQVSNTTNVYRYMLKSFSKNEEYDIVFHGLVRLLETVHLSKSTLLPKSKQHVNFYQEALVLLWHLMNVNPAFLKRTVSKLDSNKILVPVIYLLQMSKNSPSLVGLLHMTCFILLVFSSERDFGVRLNAPFTGKLPIDIPRFTGNYADLLLLSAHKIISENLGIPSGDSLIDMLLTVICNVSAYVKSFCLESCLKIMQLTERVARPAYLFRSQLHYHGLLFLLDFINNIVQYQFEGNVGLVYSVLRNKDVFLSLDSLTFDEGLARAVRNSTESKIEGGSTLGAEEIVGEEAQNPETIEKESQSREKINSTDDMSPGSRQNQDSGVVENDNDKEEEEAKEDKSLENGTIEHDNIHIEEIPQPRIPQKSSEARTGIDPSLTEEWFKQWKSRLPLDTILKLIEHLAPKVEEWCEEAGHSDQAMILESMKKETMVGLLPQPHPIIIRTYEPNRYTALWFTSYLWGVLFTRSQALPLYDIKKIKLIIINR